MKTKAKTLNVPALPRLSYSVAETAEILGISYVSVMRLIARGLLRCSVALRHKRIPASEIQRFLDSTLNEPLDSERRSK